MAIDLCNKDGMGRDLLEEDSAVDNFNCHLSRTPLTHCLRANRVSIKCHAMKRFMYLAVVTYFTIQLTKLISSSKQQQRTGEWTSEVQLAELHTTCWGGRECSV
ncbi:hypothetical protein CBL_05568 [Carabus blaptoides fortunei]